MRGLVLMGLVLVVAAALSAPGFAHESSEESSESSAPNARKEAAKAQLKGMETQLADLKRICAGADQVSACHGQSLNSIEDEIHSLQRELSGESAENEAMARYRDAHAKLRAELERQADTYMRNIWKKHKRVRDMLVTEIQTLGKREEKLNTN